jgi:integrase/recombinase XerD
MVDYYTQSMRALQLAGKGERTQESYSRAVRQVAQFYDKPPGKISESELGEYFLHRQNVTGWSGSTVQVAQAGIRFFFKNVLRRDLHLFQYLRAKRSRPLPCILSRDEVFSVLRHVPTFHCYAFLSTVYACGLRLSEALSLAVSDVDGKRSMIHVHLGKGAKDRYVPIPKETLLLLRRYWCTHRNPRLLFPALGRGQKGASKASRTPFAKRVRSPTSRNVE